MTSTPPQSVLLLPVLSRWQLLSSPFSGTPILRFGDWTRVDATIEKSRKRYIDVLCGFGGRQKLTEVNSRGKCLGEEVLYLGQQQGLTDGNIIYLIYAGEGSNRLSEGFVYKRIQEILTMIGQIEVLFVP